MTQDIRHTTHGIFIRILFYFFSWFLFSANLQAQDGYIRNISADVLHYEFNLTLNDSTDRIEGRALINTKFTGKSDSICFDLYGMNLDGKGMSVKKVSIGPDNLKWEQRDERIFIMFNRTAKVNDTLEFVIEYEGIPADGLIISKNKFGNRTFFADHWPNRAHNYLPCIDHPYDKASVDFVITAPDRYKVVANGKLIEESDLPGIMTLTHWCESVPIPTKVMAFGAAGFSVQLAGEVDNIPVSSWVFPENRKAGFSDYSAALKPMEYYSKIIGPYPYEKLANVQSKTIYGGLENAGAVFYSENSVTGMGKAEGLIAHEIAHQWFGNCVTERDWYHVWLSEGFATYMTSLYFESTLGKEKLKSDMISARKRVLKYYEENPVAVIDTTITDLMGLLNENSYQKGAWILHMLRHEVGDEAFIKGLKLYYIRFINSNALTGDFMKIMEEVSGRQLDNFFRQWLYNAGQPELKIWKNANRKNGLTEVYIEQKQDHLFDFSLDLMIKTKADEKIFTVNVKERETKIIIPLVTDFEIISDPNVNLLFKQY